MCRERRCDLSQAGGVSRRDPWFHEKDINEGAFRETSVRSPAWVRLRGLPWPRPCDDGRRQFPTRPGASFGAWSLRGGDDGRILHLEQRLRHFRGLERPGCGQRNARRANASFARTSAGLPGSPPVLVSTHAAGVAARASRDGWPFFCFFIQVMRVCFCVRHL